jgi:hypothetical protein
MPSPLASTFACKLPSTESYFNRCASVLALVRSLTATKSMFWSPRAARMMLRPMRPNPLMPTLTAIEAPLSCPVRMICRAPGPHATIGTRALHGMRSYAVDKRPILLLDAILLSRVLASVRCSGDFVPRASGVRPTCRSLESRRRPRLSTRRATCEGGADLWFPLGLTERACGARNAEAILRFSLTDYRIST